MNQSSLTFRKRAVFTGIKPFLTNDEALLAMVLWEDTHAQKPKFSMRHFISDLHNVVGCDLDARRLHVSVVSCLSKSEKDLLPDPSLDVTAFKIRNNINSKYDYKIPELEAFQIFVRKWFKLTDKPDLLQVFQQCQEYLDQHKIDLSLKANFIFWLDDYESNLQLLSVEINDLRKLTNVIYMAYCDVLGPIKADQLLAKSIELVRNNGGAAYTALYSKLL